MDWPGYYGYPFGFPVRVADVEVVAFVAAEPGVAAVVADSECSTMQDTVVPTPKYD